MGHAAPSKPPPRPVQLAAETKAKYPLDPWANARAALALYQRQEREREGLIAVARVEYVEGRIEIDEFEAAVEHVLQGGRGCEEFPYLPVPWVMAREWAVR